MYVCMIIWAVWRIDGPSMLHEVCCLDYWAVTLDGKDQCRRSAHYLARVRVVGFCLWGLASFCLWSSCSMTLCFLSIVLILWIITVSISIYFILICWTTSFSFFQLRFQLPILSWLFIPPSIFPFEFIESSNSLLVA